MEKGYEHTLYRKRYLQGKDLNLTSPIDVSLELASNCNQACVYCYHADQKNLPFAKGFMPRDTAYMILGAAERSGVSSLKFNYRGEATLNPHFSEILLAASFLKSKSVFIDRVLNSNFKFKTDTLGIFLALFSLTKVKVSFDSFRKDIFESQRKGGVLELALANVDKFYNMPGRMTEIVIQAVRTQANKDEDLEGEIRKRWKHATPSIRDMVTGRVDKDLSQEVLKELPTERQSCIQAHSRLIFDWQGNAQMCCPDIASKLKLGNIKDKTIFELFNLPFAKNLRQQLKTGKAFQSDPCKTCPSFESYRGYKPPLES